MNQYILRVIVFYFLILNSGKIQAQFFLNGSAVSTSDSCFQLTPAVNSQAGSIWNGEKLNLEESFEISFDLFVGCQDDLGADGVVFGLQPINTSVGGSGGALGFGAVEPSLGVEFDTYQNVDYGDPTFDHITIIGNGVLNHNLTDGSLAGPIQTNPNNPNIENCQFHSIQILWDANSQTMSVFYDCDLRLSYAGDIVNEIFNGDPLVFWGFTSGTGGLNNVHEVCLTNSNFYESLVDQSICPGTEIQLEANGGVSYLWSPAEGLSDINIANPIASPVTTTLYSVEITDACGNAYTNEVLITVENNLFEVEIDATPNIPTEVSPETEFSLMANVTPSGGNYTYQWTTILGSIFSNPNSSSTSMTTSNSQVGEETVTVSVEDENGCIDEASFTFEIIQEDYDIPNVFTPNGDQINDNFGIVNGGGIDNFNCKIFNRWGNKVFETNNASEFWDGTFNEKAQPSDVYIYVMNFEIGNVRYEEKGDVTLIR